MPGALEAGRSEVKTLTAGAGTGRPQHFGAARVSMTMNHSDAQDQRFRLTNGKAVAPERPARDPDQEGHARTHAMLAALAERVEALERVQAATKPHEGRSHREDRVGQMLNGKFVALFNLTGSTATLLPILLGLIVTLSQSLPIIPKGFSGLPGILFPFCILTAAVAAIVSAGRWIGCRSRRIRFLAAVMGCYGLATASYMLWLSLGLLHLNTLPSGFLLAACWYGAFSVLRRSVLEVREMGELSRAEEARDERD